MRTKEEIQQEVARLKALKPIGKFMYRTVQTIKLAIEELEHGYDDTAPEFYELEESQRDMIWTARNWKNGDNDQRPSEGWRVENHK